MDGCETMEVWLSLRLDGMLEPEEERELEAHLAVCPRCRALAQELEAVHTAFPQLEDCSAPEGFAPVSYTHLDVYKRQGPCRWTGWQTAEAPDSSLRPCRCRWTERR